MLKNFEKQILEDVKSGLSYVIIAKKYQCSISSISIIARNNGIRKITNHNYGILESKEEEVLNLYNQGLSAYKIAQLIECNRNSILSFLRKRGLKSNAKNKVDNNNLLKDKKDLVIELYKTKSLDEIAKIVGHSSGQIYRLLEREGIPMTKIKYSFNEHFLDKINHEHKAYLLGLFYADGNVLLNGKCRISLKETDRDIIDKLHKILECEQPLIFASKKGNVQRQICLNIDRKYFADRLIALGCPPNKSLILQFPSSDIVPDYLLHHFVRGYFDGDGHISKNYCNITGSYDFIYALAKKLPCQYTGIYQRYKEKGLRESAHGLYICRDADMLVFIKWIYQDATLYLDRKYNVYQEILKGKL